MSGVEVRHHTTDDVIDFVAGQREGRVALIVVDVPMEELRSAQEIGERLQRLVMQGFNRVMVNGEVMRIADAVEAGLEPGGGVVARDSGQGVGERDEGVEKQVVRFGGDGFLRGS